MAKVLFPRVGDRVLYVLNTGRVGDWKRSDVRPAVVVAVSEARLGELPLVCLQVLTNGPRDAQRDDGDIVNVDERGLSRIPYSDEPTRRAHSVLWRGDVAHDAGRSVGTWHWPAPEPIEFVELPEKP